MHFVLLNQFYPPEVLPTGVMLEAVAEALVARGHEVTVVCGDFAGRQSPVVGPERQDGVRVVRLWAPGWGRRRGGRGGAMRTG